MICQSIIEFLIISSCVDGFPITNFKLTLTFSLINSVLLMGPRKMSVKSNDQKRELDLKQHFEIILVLMLSNSHPFTCGRVDQNSVRSKMKCNYNTRD